MRGKVIIYLKDGTQMPAEWFNNAGGGMYDFSLLINGEEKEFMYIDPTIRPLYKDEPKWKERDYATEKRQGVTGFYKAATLDFDRIEVSYTLE